MRIALTAIGLLALTSCTSISYEDPAGTNIQVSRFWSDVNFSMSPDGSINYSSDADTAAAITTQQMLLRLLMQTQGLTAP